MIIQREMMRTKQVYFLFLCYLRRVWWSVFNWYGKRYWGTARWT